MDKPIVKNAADKNQVRNAKVKSELARDKELNDMRSILNTPEGRRVLWRFLERLGVFKSNWRPSAEIHYLSGQQDAGRMIMAEIVAADENQLFKMMTENKERLEGTLNE